MKLSPRAKQIASGLTIVAAVVLVGRVIQPRLRHDVTVHVSLAPWHDRALRVRAVSVCVQVDGDAVCTLERRLDAVPPSVLTQTMRIPEGDVVGEVRVMTDDAVQERSSRVHVDPSAPLELSGPSPER